jgi:hypothetical protein
MPGPADLYGVPTGLCHPGGMQVDKDGSGARDSAFFRSGRAWFLFDKSFQRSAFSDQPSSADC